jgi:NUMOD3 motif
MTFVKGNVPWNKGMKTPLRTRRKQSRANKGQNMGHKVLKKTRKNISQSLIGNIPWNKGKHTDITPVNAFKPGHIPANKGKHRTRKTRNIIREKALLRNKVGRFI